MFFYCDSLIFIQGDPMTVKKIALVAHDRMKKELIEWIKKHQNLLKHHELYATGSTGQAIEKILNVTVTKMESGPLGGDLQLGAKIVNKEIDILIFFWDPLEAQPHDPDVRALLRIAVVWNLPVACNASTADYLLTSPLFDSDYHPETPDYEAYRNRII
ncbi:methylglyoxal synthase [Coxiella burnetii]|uniref:methylglyoxal synthase n=1 Tax=Coxiella burnetii TaxID=777 RepID=UPI000183CF14|nr:methylglyoxal synthase [Coxiella burnetii]ACJ19977.1 methylglyoxal synthase [Coxiella burnetii CbuK_Q154]ATN85429.1 methylglyoxal synthase [Coxiella burnetii str. Schperling]EAX32091.2 methylglyoxal synthase [Coxiella burnetii 'MSU Goat Q177']PHH58315.1 methylglyoxal synthase [Coxiella burnetii]UYK70456.1 methylglyoxal synthase [Coxiella burnetii]